MSNIEDRLDRIERKLDALLAAMKGASNARPSAPNAQASQGNQGGVDGDVDIDGPRGDPEVRFMPKRWTGADYKGQKFSSCDPEFLDMLADAYEWFAQRDDESGAVDKNGAPKSKWSRLDASRARAWSARLRGDSGAAPARSRGPAPSQPRRAPSPPPSNGRGAPDMGMGSSFDDEIPF